MSGIGIILNPRARSYKHNPERVQRLGFIVGDRASCHATRDILDVELLAKEFKEKEIEILGISGGDGTNHVTLTTFIKVYGDKPLPKIAFLRGGTMNNVTNALGIKGLPEKILANLIYKYHAQEPFKTTEIDMMGINGKYGFLWGCGLVNRFVEEYYKGYPTPTRAAVLLTHALSSAMFNTDYILRMCERFDARVTVDGVVWPYKNYATLMAGTMETLGLHFDPFYRAREKPGHLHIIGASAVPQDILAAFPWIFMRKKVPNENFIEAVAKEVVIELEKPISHQIDGDIQKAVDRISITCGPRLTCIVS